jgi:hypothetical protein
VFVVVEVLVVAVVPSVLAPVVIVIGGRARRLDRLRMPMLARLRMLMLVRLVVSDGRRRPQPGDEGRRKRERDLHDDGDLAAGGRLCG